MINDTPGVSIKLQSLCQYISRGGNCKTPIIISRPTNVFISETEIGHAVVRADLFAYQFASVVSKSQTSSVKNKQNRLEAEVLFLNCTFTPGVSE